MAKKKKKKKAEHYRTGQYVKPKRTGKVTTNLSQEEWETDTSKPISSRTGVIGQQKKLKKKKTVSAGDRRGPHFRDPVTGKVPDYDELWSLRTGEGAPKETDEQRTARLKRERAKKAKYEAEHRKPYTLEEIGKEGFKNRAMKEEYERGLKREQRLKGVTTPPRKPRNVLKAITDPNVLPAIIDERTEGYAGMKKGGSTRRKTGGALGTGAALRGYGKGYKKGGTI